MRTIHQMMLLPALFILGLYAAQAQPRIHVVEGSEYDWGRVVPGTMKAKIHVTNIGSDTLDIARVATSCGCTTAPIDKSKLVRGDTAILDVSIDMKNRAGAQAKEVVLISNDTATPNMTIRFMAFIERDIVVHPTLFPAMMGLAVGQEVSSTVEVTNTGTDTVTLGEPRLEGADLHAHFLVAPRVLKPGEKGTITAYFKPQTEGYLLGSVVIPSNSRSVPTAEVRVICQVKETVPTAAAPAAAAQ